MIGLVQNKKAPADLPRKGKSEPGAQAAIGFLFGRSGR